MAPVLAYWDIRGIIESTRLMLYHLGVDFEDKRYPIPAPDELTNNPWINERETLGLDFPNLPYYIDGDVKITQSLAILRYLANKHGLVPTSAEGKLKADMLEQIGKDFIQVILRHAYYPPDDNALFKEHGEKRLFETIKRLSENLGDKQWFIEDKLSYADFILVESLDQLSYRHPRFLKEFPNIGAIIQRLFALPNVQKYVQGGKFKAWPLYSYYVRWGGSGEAPKREF